MHELRSRHGAGERRSSIMHYMRRRDLLDCDRDVKCLRELQSWLVPGELGHVVLHEVPRGHCGVERWCIKFFKLCRVHCRPVRYGGG